MKIITGHTGYAHVKAEDAAALNKGIVSGKNVVFETGKKMTATLMSNNIVRINSGDMLYNGRHVRIETYEDVQMQNGTQGVNRTDLIVARYTIDGTSGIESVKLVAIKGTGSVAATPLVGDMPLYKVTLQGVTIKSIVGQFSVIPCLDGMCEQQFKDLQNTHQMITDVYVSIEEANNRAVTAYSLAHDCLDQISQLRKELTIFITSTEKQIKDIYATIAKLSN